MWEEKCDKLWGMSEKCVGKSKQKAFYFCSVDLILVSYSVCVCVCVRSHACMIEKVAPVAEQYLLAPPRPLHLLDWFEE